MLNKALKISREFHRIKQKDLAQELGISASYLSEIEGGSKNPSLELLEKYGRVFDIPPSTFLLFVERASHLNTSRAASKNAERLLSFLEWVMDEPDESNTEIFARNEKVSA